MPLAWMFLAGSRWVSSWLNVAPSFASANDYAEGSPVDRAVFFALIVAGIVILARRKIDWQRLLLNNKWIVLYLLYCLASMAWSDEPTHSHETVGQGFGESDHGPRDPDRAASL